MELGLSYVLIPSTMGASCNTIFWLFRFKTASITPQHVALQCSVLMCFQEMGVLDYLLSGSRLALPPAISVKQRLHLHMHLPVLFSEETHLARISINLVVVNAPEPLQSVP